MKGNSGTAFVSVRGVGDFRLPPGERLRAALRAEGVLVDGACLDAGSCGRCAVKVVAGDPGTASPGEKGLLRSQGMDSPPFRLACQVTVAEGLSVEIAPDRLLEVDRTGRWKEAWGSPLWDPARFPPDPRPSSRYGVALDLGTTALVAALLDLADGRPLDVVSRANPQAGWGADILSRLQAAREAPEALESGIRSAAGAMVRALAARNGLSPGEVGRATVVGNTAMRAIFLGQPAAPLLTPPFEAREKGEERRSFAQLGWGGKGEADFPAALGGFVGSDALAALLAARGGRFPQAAAKAGAPEDSGLLLDIGTNCEILAWSRGRILAASAPAGPAFEGGHISRGMRAEEGAIFRFRLTGEGTGSEVIGGGDPRGICGTGIVDAAGELVRLGLLDRRGLMRAGAHPALSEKGLALDGPGGGLLFTPADLATLQKAKAAVAAGVDVVLGDLGVGPRDLDSVYLAGAFGSRLDLSSAERIGLLPPLPAGRFLPVGNAALLGAGYLLLSPGARKEASRLAKGVVHLSLAQHPGFGERFLDNLPLSRGGGPA